AGQVGHLVGQMGFGLVSIHAVLRAHMHLPVADLKPEAPSCPEGCGLFDFGEAEDAAVKFPRLLLRSLGNGDLGVVQPDDPHGAPSRKRIENRKARFVAGLSGWADQTVTSSLSFRIWRRTVCRMPPFR